jgi:putative ABC transport system permease protein
MKLRDLLFLSFRYASSRILETLVVVLSMAIGVAVFTTAVGLIRAYAQDLDQTLTSPEFREINVWPSTGGRQILDRPPADPPRLTAEDAARAAAECPAVSHGYVRWGIGESGSDGGALIATRVTPGIFAAWELEAAQGTLLVDEDIREARAVAVIGDGIARRLFKGASPIGQTIGYAKYRVIGVLRPAPSSLYTSDMSGSIDSAVFVPCTYMPWKEITSSPNLAFMVPRGGSMEAAETQLKAFFNRQYGEGTVSVFSLRGRVVVEQKIAVPFSALVAVVAGTILVCLSIAILNLLFHRVARRRASIGLASAVGASRRDTFRLYFTEFMLTGLVGGFLGVLLSLAFGQVVQGVLNPEGSAIPGLRIAVNAPTVGFALAFVLALELLLSLLPTLQATHTSPVEAMRGGQG